MPLFTLLYVLPAIQSLLLIAVSNEGHIVYTRTYSRSRPFASRSWFLYCNVSDQCGAINLYFNHLCDVVLTVFCMFHRITQIAYIIQAYHLWNTSIITDYTTTIINLLANLNKTPVELDAQLKLLLP